MIRLRPTTIKDLALLQYWGTKRHVFDSDPSDDWNWEYELSRNPVWREQLIAEYNDEPIGFIQIIDPYLEETHFWGDVDKDQRAIDIWIGEERNLNKGYGTIMMRKAIERCFKNPQVHKVLVDPLKSNVGAHRFYERLGFKFCEDKVLGDLLCCIYKLERELCET